MNLTIGIFIGVIVLVGIYDVYTQFFRGSSGGYQTTISYLLYHISCQYPPLPFAIGFALGHALWLNPASCPPP